MKQNFKKILANPKRVITLSILLALAIGIISSLVHSKTLEQRFSTINDFPITGTSSDIKSKQNLTLAFPVGGRIKAVTVKIGDTVQAGAILASLDAENAIGAVNQAKAAYSSAQTAYDKLVNGASTPDIDIAKVTLNNAKSSFDNITAQQKVAVANAQSAMMNAGLSAIPTTNTTDAVVCR